MPRIIRALLIPTLALTLSAADLNALLDSARAARRQNDIAAAQSAYDSALELALADPNQRLTQIAVEVSTFYTQQRNSGKAEVALKRAVDAEDGASVPAVNEISLFGALADLYSRDRRLPDLAAAQTRLVQAWETSAGPDSAVLANALSRLAGTQEQTGDYAAAERSIQRSLAIIEAKYGSDAPSTGYALNLLSSIEKRLGKDVAAEQAYKRAAGITQKQPGTVGAVRIGPQVTAPRVVSRQEPQYTEEARHGRIQGSVLLSFVVDESGNTRDIAVMLPLGAGLDEAAIETVRQWHFQPGQKNGQPVAVQATVEVNFRLL